MRERCWGWFFLAISVTACEPGRITLVGHTGEPGRETMLELPVILEDTALADALDLEAGVPGARAEWAFVHHRRYLFRGAGSDDSGVIRFEPEGAGWHWVAAEKEVEIDGERRVLGGGVKVSLSRGADLSLRLDEPGTLVISEVYMHKPPPWEVGGYDGSKYIELYNNSTEVLYLDGMILGVAYSFWFDASENGHHSCSYTKPFREDPGAVWSAGHFRFPGTGTEHPIGPGEARVVAVSAADHTGVHPSMLDLSDADFEFRSGGTADNPAALNLENVSTRSLGNELLPGRPWFIAQPLDLDALQVMTDDDFLNGTRIDYRGFPASEIVDVATLWVDTTSDPVIIRSRPCEHPIHPTFDALPGGYLYGETRPEDLLVASQRRVIRTRNGQPVLLDTNTSAVDFENVGRTPGWVP